jgi:hypothetical protein
MSNISYRLEPTKDKKYFYLDIHKHEYDELDNETIIKYDSLKRLSASELDQLSDFIKEFLKTTDYYYYKG